MDTKETTMTWEKAVAISRCPRAYGLDEVLAAHEAAEAEFYRLAPAARPDYLGPALRRLADELARAAEESDQVPAVNHARERINLPAEALEG
jgi:hypothetical protein